MPEPEGERGTPTMRRRRLGFVLLIILLFLIAGSCVMPAFMKGTPETYRSDEDHFKYGSIGSDNLRRGIPYRIFMALPAVFEDLLHDPDLVPPNDKHGYARLGIIEEASGEQPVPDDLKTVEFPRPIGFSKRRVLGLDVVGINCAFCHVSRVRGVSENCSKPISRMPANGLYAEAFFRFLARAGKDPRFTNEHLLSEMVKQDPTMPWYQRLLYQQFLIPSGRLVLKNLGRHLAFLEEKPRPRFGPGRVETWAIYKILTLQHALPLVDLIPDMWSFAEDQDPRPGVGFADFPAIWRTKPDQGWFHWDGNNPDLSERNMIAGMGAGITPPSRDDDGLKRVGNWIEQTPPPHRYNDCAPPDMRVNETSQKWTRGKAIYYQLCAFCHEMPNDPKKPMDITPITRIGTDRSRLDSYTVALNSKLNRVGWGYPWYLHKFTKTDGYANMTLAGIWLRAPYLHNGSVPTLRDLLNKSCERPHTFNRGDEVYDWKKVGFQSARKYDGTHYFFEYNTAENGNGNGGHEGPDYGTELSDTQKEDLLEYLKTL